jgi:hypothetical protein
MVLDGLVLFCFFFSAMIHDHGTDENSPKAEIKNENVAPARRQTNTNSPSEVQCRARLSNSVFMITEVGVQVSGEKNGLSRLYT